MVRSPSAERRRHRTSDPSDLLPVRVSARPRGVDYAWRPEATGFNSYSCVLARMASFQPLSRTSKCTQSGPMNFSFGAFRISCLRPAELSRTCGMSSSSDPGPAEGAWRLAPCHCGRSGTWWSSTLLRRCGVAPGLPDLWCRSRRSGPECPVLGCRTGNGKPRMTRPSSLCSRHRASSHSRWRPVLACAQPSHP